MYGHTYVYTHSPEDAEEMLDVLALQDLAGRVPSLVADIIADIVIGGSDE